MYNVDGALVLYFVYFYFVCLFVSLLLQVKTKDFLHSKKRKTLKIKKIQKLKKKTNFKDEIYISLDKTIGGGECNFSEKFLLRLTKKKSI